MTKYEVKLVVDAVEVSFIGSSLKSLASQAVNYLQDKNINSPLVLKHLKSLRFFFRTANIQCSLTQI